jgi:hypothetical protein
MGVRGLAGKVHRQFLTSLDGRCVRGAHILVDGPNVAYPLESELDQNAVTSPYNEYLNTLDKFIDSLVALEPAAVTFYFDGGWPEAKTPVRFERARNKLKRPTPRVVTAVSFTCVYLKKHRPDIRVELVAGEAEEAIISDIVRMSEQTRTDLSGEPEHQDTTSSESASEVVAKQRKPLVLVVSDDSDFFRYTGISNTVDVHVLPFSKNYFCKNPVNLKSILLTPSVLNMVTPSLRIPARVIDTASSFPEYALDKTQDFLLNILSHKSFVQTLPTFDEVKSMPPCWLCGRIYRSYAYSVLIRDHGTSALEKCKYLQEAYRIGVDYTISAIGISVDDIKGYEEHLDPFLSDTDGLIEAIINEIQRNPGPGYEKSRDSTMMHGLESHLKAVFGIICHPGGSSRKRGTTNSDRASPLVIPRHYNLETRQLHSKVLATLYSIMLLESALQRQILANRSLVDCTLNTNANLLQYWLNHASDHLDSLDVELGQLKI